MSNAPAGGQYAAINGLDLYFEIHGEEGYPLVLVHGGGSTLMSTFGRILPLFAAQRRVIAVEMQAHGRTADIDRPLSFTQDADDLAGLMKHLGITSADFMGFSNGGTSCLQLAIRHPQLVRKLVTASANFSRAGMPADFWEGMKGASLDNMPQPLKEAFLEVNADPVALQAMFNRDVQRMLSFNDIEERLIAQIKAPTLVLNGDADVVTVEHALQLSRLLPDGRLLVLPSGHGEYLGEASATDPGNKMPALVADMINIFLDC